jgi:AraC-like DNA-binding protein
MENIPVRKIQAPSKEPPLSENFSIRNIRDLLTGGDMIQELHRHDFFYILALGQASGDHEIDFNLYPVCDNSIFIMRPGQVHKLTLKAGSTGYLLQFKPGLLYPPDKTSDHLLRKASKINLHQPDTKQCKMLLSILQYISREYSNKEEGYQAAIKAHLDIFFIELIRMQNKGIPDIVKTYHQERLEEFSALLEIHIINHKQVAHYADLLHLSAYQLNAITRTTLGKTCSEVINEYIILESKRYLLATSNQVKEIAWHLGYEDVSYFIRFFKKHTGYSPDAFRYHSG